MTRMHEKPLVVLESEDIVEWKGSRLVRDRVRLPSGKNIDKFTVRHPGAVVILPAFDDGSMLLTWQYRHAIGHYILELPAGTLEPEEAPLACAQREVQEEVGHSAGQWIELGTMYPAPGFCDEIQHFFIARELVPTHLDPDEDEVIEVRRYASAQVDEAIASGEIVDGKSLALIARARARGLA